MAKIRDLYIVHHSHTDIGYTDLQETIMYNHMDYIRSAIKTMKEGYASDTVEKKFRWNCETYYCVEKFLLEEATEQEKEDFFELVRKGNMGMSATYLNFTDLADKAILTKRTKKMIDLFKSQEIEIKVAMNADINGISLGALDAFLDNNIEFLYTNIHCHHGMYPLYQNQKAYFWENKVGKKLLVWSGEHYNLGNAMGLVYDKKTDYIAKMNAGITNKEAHAMFVKQNLDQYFKECEEYHYAYDFMPLSLSGVFSDNAPPNPEIIHGIEQFNALYGDEIRMHMVTLEELYEAIKDKLQDSPSYQGDLTDWWAHGVGSTPYEVKHYKEAQRMYALTERLDPEHQAIREDVLNATEENLLVYAEHTWGHSSTITNPYDTMVLNLDMRKASYASKAHEGAAKNLTRVLHSKGDKLRYYDRDGKVKAINASDEKGMRVVQFFIEAWGYTGVEIVEEVTGTQMDVQISSHPRGVLLTFVDEFSAHEEKIYNFKELPKVPEVIHSRSAYRGSEGIRDIVNEYDTQTYKLSYGIENEFFRIGYEIGKGVTSFYNKVDEVEMLKEGDAKFFTPIYECTEIRTNVYEERRLHGRNIRGRHATKHIAELIEVKVIDQGKVFTTVELVYKLEGTYFSSVVIKMYSQLPRIDFKYKVAKTLTENVENILLPLALDLPKTTYADKGDVSFKLGVEQIPGTCMEYYLIDNGVVYQGEKNSIAIQTLDAPLIYTGEIKHHPIELCDNKEENNQRDVYSWIMNNIWETNFKIDLSGITEFCYSLNLFDTKDVDESFKAMKDQGFGAVAFITE